MDGTWRSAALVGVAVLVLVNLFAPVHAQEARVDVVTRGPFEATLRYAVDQDPVVWSERFVLPSWADWAEVELRGTMGLEASSGGGWINVSFEVRLDDLRVDQQTQDVSTAASRTVSLDAVMPSPTSEADRPRFDVTSLTERTLTTVWSAEPRTADPQERAADIVLEEVRVVYGASEAEVDLTPWFWAVAAVAFVVLAPIVAVVLARRLVHTDPPK